MKIDVVTLFESFFDSPLATGLVGKAIDAGRAEVRTIDPRTFTSDRHRTVDGSPYGGRAGMVMRPEPMLAALAEARARGDGPVVLLSPQGQPLQQADVAELAGLEHFVLVAGRYEGFDERIRAHVDREISIGDFVLTGGEYGALVLIDAVIRLLPGTVGNTGSTEADSFSDGLLEHPHYTRPALLGEDAVPDVLQGGDHGKVAAWRHRHSLLRTRQRRPDLLERRALSIEERRLLWDSEPPRSEVTLVLGGVHDFDAAARLAAAYRLHRVILVDADPDTLARWRADSGSLTPPRLRGSKKARAQIRSDFEAISANWASARQALGAGPVEPSGTVILVGDQPGERPIWDPATALPAQATLVVGAALDAGYTLPVVRGVTPHPGLAPLAEAAIAVDRLIGER